MKTFLQCCALLSFAIAALVPAYAQITITAADVGATLAVGTSFTSKVDTVTRTANIGTPGATSWDFSALITNFTSTFTSVDPGTTLFTASFPGTTHAWRLGAGGAGTSYSYYKLGTNLLFSGVGVSGTFPTLIRFTPEQVFNQLPMTLGTSWTTTYVEKDSIALPAPLPPQINVSNQTVDYTVDAYGNLTLPGVGVNSALRIKSDRRTVVSGRTIRTISYQIIAKNGTAATVVAADTLQPNSGTINVSSISWNGPVGSASSVREVSEGNVPSSFALDQNYPNPFNPTTKLQFQIPEARFVTLIVYNLLGQEVATLVNEYLSAGEYRTEFDASHLPSGIYLYRLRAGSYTEAKKMALMK